MTNTTSTPAASTEQAVEAILDAVDDYGMRVVSSDGLEDEERFAALEPWKDAVIAAITEALTAERAAGRAEGRVEAQSFALNTQGHLVHTLQCAGWEGERCSCLVKELIEQRDRLLTEKEPS